jgi:hypothetical protein
MTNPNIKAWLKANFPAILKLRQWTISSVKSLKSTEKVFGACHRSNSWGCPDSVSGPGSTLEQTKTVRQELPLLVRRLGVKTFLDVPCGDFNWMEKVDLEVDHYIGADIVAELIADNTRKYAAKNRSFVMLNILKNEIPHADVIFCRDCLVHFSFQHIFCAIRNFKASGSDYLATTTFTERDSNTDIVTGGWRPINLELPPFCFPKPISIINERCTEQGGAYGDKSLGMWRLSDLHG